MIRASEPSRWSASMAPSTLVARSYSNEAGVCTTSLLSLPVGAVFWVGRVAIDLTRHGGRVLQVRLSFLRRLGPPIGGRVGLVAGARVDAALSSRLTGYGRLSEDRAAELTILRQHLARRVGSSELGGDDALGGGFGPRALLADLCLIRCGPAALLARRVLDGRAGADHRRPRQLFGARLARLGIERARLEAAALHVPKHRALGARGGDRRLSPEPRERERPLRVHLRDARWLDGLAVGEVAQPLGRGPRIETFDQSDRVRQARLLHEQALEQVDARVEVGVDVLHDVLDGSALLDDLAHPCDRLVEPRRDLPQRDDRREEVVDEREDDQQDRDDQHYACRRHLLLLRVVDDHVEGGAVARHHLDRCLHVRLRREQQRHGVEVFRPGPCGRRDAPHARNDAAGGVEHALQQIHDHGQDHCKQEYVADPPEGHRGLLSATTAALAAIPGIAPTMTSNWALIALTAGSSGRRCSDSTVSRASASVVRPLDVDSRRARMRIRATATTATATIASRTLRRSSVSVSLMTRRTRRSKRSYSGLAPEPPPRSGRARGPWPGAAGCWLCCRRPCPRPRAGRPPTCRCRRRSSRARSGGTRRSAPRRAR